MKQWIITILFAVLGAPAGPAWGRAALLQSLPPPSWTQILVVFGVVVFLLAAGYYNWKRGSDHAGDRALDKWKNLAEATEAENVKLKARNAELEATVEAQGRELKSCDEFRNDVAREFLQSAARERRYQQCINRLEIALHLHPTDFNDPTIHITEGAGR